MADYYLLLQDAAWALRDCTVGLDQLANELDAAAEYMLEFAAVYSAVQEFLDYMDTHVPGQFINDVNAGPDPVQLCADDDCLLYWPCPVETLRRAVGTVRSET